MAKTTSESFHNTLGIMCSALVLVISLGWTLSTYAAYDEFVSMGKAMHISQEAIDAVLYSKEATKNLKNYLIISTIIFMISIWMISYFIFKKIKDAKKPLNPDIKPKSKDNISIMA